MYFVLQIPLVSFVCYFVLQCDFLQSLIIFFVLASICVPLNHVVKDTNIEPLKIFQKSPYATKPNRGSPWSPGFELSACEKVIVPAGGRTVIDTGLEFKIQRGYYGRISSLNSSRSGLAVNGIDVIDDSVDADLHERAIVILFNHGTVDFIVNVGDRIAQIIITKISTTCYIDLISEIDEPSWTARGEGGLNSSKITTIDSSSLIPASSIPASSSSSSSSSSSISSSSCSSYCPSTISVDDIWSSKYVVTAEGNLMKKRTTTTSTNDIKTTNAEDVVVKGNTLKVEE